MGGGLSAHNTSTEEEGQEEQKFKVISGYIASLKSILVALFFYKKKKSLMPYHL